MQNNNLVWTEEGRNKIFDCKVFSVWESSCKPPDSKNRQGENTVFSVIEAKDWAIVIPVIETPKGKQFVMVRQWRHGSKCLSLEFPGGVFEPGENPEEAAARELFEETFPTYEIIALYKYHVENKRGWELYFNRTSWNEKVQNMTIQDILNRAYWRYVHSKYRLGIE